jgi:hypothetical protein
MADHFEAYHPDTPRRPVELVLEIILPGVPDPGQIDAEVLPKTVSIRAPGSFRGRPVLHSLLIPLPFNVQTNVDYSASWGQQLLTLRLRVRQPAITRRPFELHETPDSDDDTPAVQALEEIAAEAAAPAPAAASDPGPQVVKEMKFSLTTEEKVVTIVLYVPRAREETLAIEDNVISITTKNGQLHRARIEPPFPLLSKPVIKANPVMVYLIFIEGDDERPQEEGPAPLEPFNLEDEIPPLKNPYIFELEP